MFKKFQNAKRCIGWFLDITASYKEFDVLFIEKKISDKLIKRFHLVRKFNSSLRGIPLLVDIISEGQAETIAAFYSGVNSTLLNSFGSEKHASELKYNTLPNLFLSGLKQYPLAEAIFFCTDFALMTFSPDLAFIEAYQFLSKNTNMPKDKSDWTKLRLELESKSSTFLNSKLMMIKELEAKKEYFNKFKDKSIMFEMFSLRIEQFEKSQQKRISDPLWLFPWNRDKDYFADILKQMPASHVRFIDGVYNLGDATPKEIKLHTIQVTIKHFLSFLEGENTKCPFYNDQITCNVSRNLSCSSAPWGRGDIGDGNSCLFGIIGFFTGTQNSEMIPFSKK